MTTIQRNTAATAATATPVQTPPSTTAAEPAESMPEADLQASFESGGMTIGAPSPSPSSVGNPALSSEVKMARNTMGVQPHRMRHVPAPTLEQVRDGAELTKGMKGDSVKWMQQELNRLGATPPLVADGEFGKKTELALKAAQEQLGSEPTGTLTTRTQTAFEEAFVMDLDAWLAARGPAAQPRSNEAVVPMAQGDYPEVKVGNSNLSMSTVGCMVTAFAMASTAITGNRDMNPKMANDLMKANDGFAGAGLKPKEGAAALGMKLDARVIMTDPSHAANVARIDESLAAGRPVVIGVDYKPGSKGSSLGTGVDHWILVVGKNDDGSYRVIDSADGREVTMHVGDDGLLHGRSAGGDKTYVTREMILLNKA